MRILTNDERNLVDGGHGQAHHEATGDPRPEIGSERRQQTEDLLHGETHQEGDATTEPEGGAEGGDDW